MASKLEHKYNNNWKKANRAIVITKEGIQPFVEETVRTFQERCISDIWKRNNLPEGETCKGCSLQDLKLKSYCCPKNICTEFRDKIHQAHTYHKIHQAHTYRGPSFENTDVSGWCTNSWEVAKCYMTRGGYRDVKTAADTDFNGIINVIINHRELASKVCIQNFERGRKSCNTIRHSPSQSINDEDLQNHLEVLEDMLTDNMYLASCVYAQNARDQLSKLRNTNMPVESLQTVPSYDTKLQALTEDLLTFYKEMHSSIPISPLVPENDVPIVDFYVQQSMEQVELNAKGKQKTNRTSVASYEAMFMNGSAFCRSIYIMAQAGAGKTTFAKRLCNVWCFAKGGGDKEPKNLSKSATATLNNFDILFLLLLRDVQGSECDIDEMIKSQIIRNLSRSRDYDDEFLNNVLHHQTCLVILDGLDEWSHPQATNCQNVTQIPHSKTRPNCTILSTTRPWKMFESEISNTMIDKCIELKEFDESSTDNLISNVMSNMSTFTDTPAHEKKETKDLQVQMKRHNLNWLICTPLILIQLVCLWLDNKTLGESRCQIYSNIIDFLLERADKKVKISKPPAVQSEESNTAKILTCLRNNWYCKMYNSLLIAVGKLAFKALCSETRELSLVFGSSMVKQTLSDEQLQDCLQSGILTENRTKHVSARRINYSFMHKTFQEYFSAVYIATVEITDDVLKQCMSVESILDLSGIFVFLCGLYPKMFNKMSVRLAEIISKDKMCQDFRRKVCTSIDWNTCYKMLKELQDMYIDCIIESEAENAESLNIIHTDLVIDIDCHNENYREHLKTLVRMNKDNIKSVKIYSEPGVALRSFIRDFTLSRLKYLDKLEMIVDILNDEDLDLLLSGSANSLKCLSICKDIGSQIDPPCDPLSESSVRTIRSMSSIEAIMLECFTMEHENLKDLFHFLEGRREMTEICLAYIKCSVHGEKCTGFKLDLSKHTGLTMLEVGSIPLLDIQLNTQSLHECRVGRFDSQNILLSLLYYLEQSPGLRSLMIFGIDRPDEIQAALNTLHKLSALRVLVIKRVNLGAHVMDIQSNLEHIKMSSVKMTSSTFDSIVKKVEDRPHAITCELLSCEIVPEEEFEKIKGHLKESETIVISYDGKEENKTYKIKFTSRPNQVS